MGAQQWSIDGEQADAAYQRLTSARFVLFPTHQHVDADGLASPLAMLHALTPRGLKGAVMVSDGQFPGNLRFLPGSEDVLRYGHDPLPDYDLVCLVDCSDRRRLGGFYADDPERVAGAMPIINIDHHITNDHFGAVNIVEPEAASTAEIIAALLLHWKAPVDKDIAQCLLAGIYGDTLGLRTEATTAFTMRTAADLVDAGANPSAITDALFRVKPRSTVCLWREALANVQWTGSLIWTEITQDMLKTCQADPSEAEGLVNFLAGTEGSRAAAILYGANDGWRTSLRSLQSDVDVASIAAEFGGGGHPRAAGVQVTGGEDAKRAFLERMAARIAIANGPD